MKNRVILGEKAQLSLPKVFIYAIFKFKLPPEIVIIKSGPPDEFRCVCYFLEVIFLSQTVYKFSRLYHNLLYALTNSSHYNIDLKDCLEPRESPVMSLFYIIWFPWFPLTFL